MSARHDVIAAAKGWIGTPYQHQARTKGAGCDCLGLILGVWQELGGALPDVPPYSQDWSEPQGDERLWRAAADLLTPRTPGAPAQIGDVVLFRMRDGMVAKHLGVMSQINDMPRFIHAMSGHGVIESHLSSPWARRVVARFALPLIGD